MTGDLLLTGSERDRQAAAEVDAVLHDAGYSAAEPVLEQLRGIAALDAPASSLPALRARVLLERLDDDGRGALLGELLAGALTALHAPHIEADAALHLYEAVRRAVERGEIRVAAAARHALRFRCEHCARDAWWLVEVYAADGRLHRIIGQQAACRVHLEDVERDLRARHDGELSTTHRALMPGNPRYPRTAPPAGVVTPPAAPTRSAS